MSWLDRRAGEEGFSLVELMVVALIIGILVSIAVVSYVISVKASKKTACDANLKVIKDQLVAYRIKYDESPQALLDLVPEFIMDEKGLRCPTSGEYYEYDPVDNTVFCAHHGNP